MPEVSDDVGFVHQREHTDQKQKSGAAEAANHDVAVHFEPPWESPRRRMIIQTPTPIRSTGHANSSRRPLKISSRSSRKISPRQIRITAPTGSLRFQNKGRQYSVESGV